MKTTNNKSIDVHCSQEVPELYIQTDKNLELSKKFTHAFVFSRLECLLSATSGSRGVAFDSVDLLSISVALKDTLEKRELFESVACICSCIQVQILIHIHCLIILRL